MKSIKLKLIIPLTVVMVICFTFISGFAYLKARDIIRSDVEALANQKVDKMVTRTEDLLNEWKEQIEMLADSPMATKLDIESIKKYTQNHKETFSFMDGILVTDKKGDIITSQGIKGSLASRAYFPRIMSGETIFSEPVVSVVTGKDIFVLATPIKDDSGAVIGALAVGVSLADLTNYINIERLGEKGYALMLDQKGVLMAHENSTLVRERYNLTEDEWAGKIATQMVNKKKGLEYYDYQGQEKIIAFSPLSTGWSIAMSGYSKDLYKELNSYFVVLLMSTVTTLLLLCLLIMVTTSIVFKPLSEMRAMMINIANGDLTQRMNFKSKDEIGQLSSGIDEMMDSMRGLLGAVETLTNKVASTANTMQTSAKEAQVVSEQMAVTINQLATGASEQAKSTQAGGNKVRVLQEEVEEVTNKTSQVVSLTGEAVEVVHQGMEIIELQKQSVVHTKTSADEATSNIEELAKRSTEIGQIINLISNIAEQTNLLALNAAIEAARAGDQGLGFAVVAEEIRHLAEQSSHATNEIQDLVKDIQDGVTNAVGNIRNTKIKVEDQEEAAIKVSQGFEEILGIVDNVHNNMESIGEASSTLNENAVEVLGSIENVASIIEENAAGTEQAAASGEEQNATMEMLSNTIEDLAQMTTELEGMIQHFKL